MTTWLDVKYTPWSMLILVYQYNDVIMGTVAPQITGLTIVYSKVYSGVDQA